MRYMDEKINNTKYKSESAPKWEITSDGYFTEFYGCLVQSGDFIEIYLPELNLDILRVRVGDFVTGVEGEYLKSKIKDVLFDLTDDNFKICRLYLCLNNV